MQRLKAKGHNYSYDEYVTVPMKRDLNVGSFESIFIVESDRASFKLQNDTKIDLLATFFPEICSRERYEGIATLSK